MQAEKERFITIKMQKPSNFSKVDIQDQVLESFSSILPNIPKMSGIEVVFRIPRTDKTLFWQISQTLKKLHAKIPDLEYFDSQHPKSNNPASFFSNPAQAGELFGNSLNNSQSQEQSQVSNLLASILKEPDPNAPDEQLPDFNISEVIPKPLPIDKLVFSVEIKDTYRFQAFLLMVQHERSANGTFFPGLEKRLSLKLEFIRGDYFKGIPNKVNAFVVNPKYNEEEAKSDETIIKNYIDRLVYQKVEIPPNKIQSNVVKIVKDLLFSEEKSIRFMEKPGHLILAGYLSRKNLIDICNRLLEMKRFPAVTVFKAPANIERITNPEEISNYFKMDYLCNTKELEMRFRILAKKNGIAGFRLSSSRGDFNEQELWFSYTAMDIDERKFRLDYEEMIKGIFEKTIFDIEENIYKFVHSEIKEIRNKLEEANNDGVHLTRIFISRYLKRKPKIRHIAIFGDDEQIVKETEEKIRSILKKYSARVYDPGDLSSFNFFRGNIATMKTMLPPEYDSFIFEENLETSVFTIYGPETLQNSFREQISKFLNERYYEDFNNFQFREVLVWQEYFKEIIASQTYPSTTAVNLTKDLTIYVHWQTVKLEKPVLFYGCYRKDKKRVYDYFEEKIKEYEKKLKEMVVLVSKDLFHELTRFLNKPEQISEHENENKVKFSFEKIEKKAQVKINFNSNEVNASSTSKYRGCFELHSTPSLLITLYQGFSSEFIEKSVNVFPVDWVTGNIFTEFFPIIKKEYYDKYIQEFEKDEEKKPFYHIRTKGVKKLKNRSIPRKRLFLCPIQDRNDPNNFIDFFERHNLENALIAVFDRLSQEEKPLERVNVFLCDTVNRYSDDLTAEILNFLKKLNKNQDFKIKTICFFDTSPERTEKLYQEMRKLEINETNRRKNKETEDLKWFFLDESLKDDWREFEEEKSKELEAGFSFYQKNPKKNEFYTFSEGNAEGLRVKLRVDIRNSLIFVDQFQQCLEVPSFFKEASPKEFDFARNDKVTQNFKDLDQKHFWFYAVLPPNEGKSLSLLRNNTCVSKINFKTNQYVQKDQANETTKRFLIKRSSMFTRVGGLTRPIQKEKDINLSEKIDFEGERVKIYIKGFEDHIKHAKMELEKLAISNSKNKGVVLPLEWDPFIRESDYFIRYELGKSAKYQEIKQRVEKTVKNLEIYRIERVQNRDLYGKFYEEMQYLGRKTDYGSNIKYMFYASERSAEEICMNRTESFDPKEQPNEVLMFYHEANEALTRTSTNKMKQKVIIYAEVLVGKSFIVQNDQKWDEKEKRPPLEGGIRLDSVEEKNGTIVRIFEKNRAYPEFLITFTEVA